MVDCAAGEPLHQAEPPNDMNGSRAQADSQAAAAAEQCARANDEARAAMDKWKADNPWWRTVSRRIGM